MEEKDIEFSPEGEDHVPVDDHLPSRDNGFPEGGHLLIFSTNSVVGQKMLPNEGLISQQPHGRRASKDQYLREVPPWQCSDVQLPTGV